MELYHLRPIQEKDNSAVEAVIRSCLIEFQSNLPGTAWEDPNLGRFSYVYQGDGNQYWVVERQDGTVVGGVGIGRLAGADGVCELQKMYCLPEVRGTGIAGQLMETALEYAGKFYQKVYLETRENMVAAKKLYERYGFCRIDKPVGDTGHYACDVPYLKDLRSEI